jgi:hypothetical protein
VHSQVRRGCPNSECQCQRANSGRSTDMAMKHRVTRMPQDIEQASRLLDATNATELDAFLRGLIDDVVRRSGATLSADGARAVLAVVKKTARQTLPTLATVFGADMKSSPWRGKSPVATAARVYGLELEGLSAEERDFEIARQLIRFAQAATSRAANPPTALPAAAAVRAAVNSAAREFAPGLLPPAPTIQTGPWPGPRVRRERPPFSSGFDRRDLYQPPYDSHCSTNTKGIPHV